MVKLSWTEATFIGGKYKMFSEGREDVNDEERAGRPSTSTTDENIDEVKKIVSIVESPLERLLRT